MRSQVEVCNKILEIKLSQVNTICLGNEVRETIFNTLLESIILLTGLGVLGIIGKVFGFRIYIKDFIIIFKQTLNSDSLMIGIRMRERNNREKFICGNIDSNEFGLKMLYIDIEIIENFCKNNITKDQATNWFIDHRWKRFKDNIKTKQNSETGEKHDYKKWFNDYTETTYESNSLDRVLRPDDKRIKIIMDCLSNSNDDEKEVRKSLGKIFNEF